MDTLQHKCAKSNQTGGDEATVECPSISVHPVCMLGAASAVITDCTVGVIQPISVEQLLFVGLNLLPLVLNSVEILELSKGGKMPMAAFVTRLRHQQRERC